MHKTKHPLQVWFRNAPLKIKITLITAFAIFLTSMASLIGSFIFMHSCNNLLFGRLFEFQCRGNLLQACQYRIHDKFDHLQSGDPEKSDFPAG